MYSDSAYSLRKTLENEIGHLYRTQCVFCEAEDAYVKYFLWVKVIPCRKCHKEVDLFPGYLLASNSRHPRNVFICHACGQLTETDNKKAPGYCNHCSATLSLVGPAKRNRCKCAYCETINSFPDTEHGPPRHRLFAIEYYCPNCKSHHKGRFFKVPDHHDLVRVNEAEERWEAMNSRYVPEDEIPSGDETNRLRRWGYNHYREMFNARQLLSLELSAQLIASAQDERVRNALATNLSDLLRYQNMLCRYDTMALKSLDIFSVHGFPVGLIQCESNFLGIVGPDKNSCIGSGGWANIIAKFLRAKAYCDNPFEIRYSGRKKEILPIKGEWIGDRLNGDHGKKRVVDIRCKDAASAEIRPASLDAVFTDPPYLGNVQYAELMDFCYIWLRRLLRYENDAFEQISTRNPKELTENIDMGRGIEHFAEGLSSVFRRMALALKPGAPLVFTYHHNDLRAYHPIAVAILDSGLTCSATLPCPAEMGASIHISGTGSSIIDSVFVCRSTGVVPKKWLVDSPNGIVRLIREDIYNLSAGDITPSYGDIRCIAYGHLIRLAIWSLRQDWDKAAPISKRIARIADWLQDFGGWKEVESRLNDAIAQLDTSLISVQENAETYGECHAEVSF